VYRRDDGTSVHRRLCLGRREYRPVRARRHGAPRPFCFASRLRIRPATAPNPALTALVERRARSGFRDRLAERDIEDIEHRGDREIAVDDPKSSRASSRRSAASQASAPGTDVYRSRRYSRSGRPASIYSAGRVPLDEASYPPGESPSDARRELLGIVRGMESPDDRSEAEL